MLVDPDSLAIICAVCGGIGFAVGWVGGFMDAIQRRREFDAKLRALGVQAVPAAKGSRVRCSATNLRGGNCGCAFGQCKKGNIL